MSEKEKHLPEEIRKGSPPGVQRRLLIGQGMSRVLAESELILMISQIAEDGFRVNGQGFEILGTSPGPVIYLAWASASK